jgi:hypothetical protein
MLFAATGRASGMLAIFTAIRGASQCNAHGGGDARCFTVLK